MKQKHLRIMKNAFHFTKKALFVLEKFNFLYFPHPLFFPFLTIPESIKEFIIFFRSKKGLILQLCQLIKYCVRKIFMQEYAEFVHYQLVPDFYLVLVNSSIVFFYEHCSKKPKGT